MNKCIRCPIVNCTVFAGVDPTAMACIEKGKNTHTIKKHAVLFAEGDDVRGIHCIFEGRVKVFQKDKHGKENILAICQAGDALGLVAMFAPSRYKVTAEAVEDSRVCLIPKENILPALERSTVFLQNVLKELAGNVHRLMTTLGEQRQISVRERIAKTLITLSQSRVPGKGSAAKFKLSRTDIASFSGTVLESAVRCLTDLKKEGVIETTGKEIRILRPDLLKKLATLSR